MDQKPSVGRIVHYHAEGIEPSNTGPFAAIITRVHSDRCIDLTVFLPGRMWFATSVDIEGAACWGWPPRV